MADKEATIFGQAARLVLDIANGRHILSKAIPPLLLVLDAVLCGLIIWKVPCMRLVFPLGCAQTLTSSL